VGNGQEACTNGVSEMSRQTDQMADFCEKVKRLEELVAHVESNVNRVEAVVSEAETDLATPQRITSILKPLLFVSPQKVKFLNKKLN